MISSPVLESNAVSMYYSRRPYHICLLSEVQRVSSPFLSTLRINTPTVQCIVLPLLICHLEKKTTQIFTFATFVDFLAFLEDN